jgi:hypothetical protein
LPEPSQPIQRSVANALVEQLSQRDAVIQQISDHENSLEVLRSELERANAVIQNVRGADTVMQRILENTRTAPVSLVDPADVAPFIALESDTDNTSESLPSA